MRKSHLRSYSIDFRRNEKENKSPRWAPLSNHKLAAPLFFQLHGFVERENGAFYFAVIGRLGGDPLQPQSGRGHQGKERAAMLGGEANKRHPR